MLKLMNILVTGISGFIGSHVAAALAALGHQVRGTYRGNAPRILDRYEQGFLGRLETGGSIEPVQADLRDKSTVEQLSLGMDAIIHIAGYANDWGSKDKFYQANVTPVRHFLDILATDPQAAKIFIHTSSLAAQGFGPHQESREDGPYYPLINEYQRSKAESERLIEQANLPQTRAAIIRPGNVYGPGDTTTLYPMLEAIAQGKMGMVDGGKHLTCPVFIDDMTSVYVALFERLLNPKSLDEPVPLYNITSGEYITWKREVELCCQSADLPMPKLSAPRWAAMLLAKILVGTYRLVGSKSRPDLTPYLIQQVGNDYHFSTEKARKDLGWKPLTDFAHGIEPTVQAWKSERV